MTSEEIKKAMAIIIDKNESRRAARLIYELWYDHDSFRIKNNNQVVKKNLEDLSKEEDISDCFPPV